MKLGHTMVALFFAVPLLLSPATATQLTISGDPQAWQRVLNAYEHFEQLKAYRMTFRKGTMRDAWESVMVPRGAARYQGVILLGMGELTVEILNPDRARYKIQILGIDLVAKKTVQLTYERIEVGTEAADLITGPQILDVPPGSAGEAPQPTGQRDWKCTAPFPSSDMPFFPALKKHLDEAVGVDVHALGQAATLEGYEYILLFKDPKRRLFSERLLIRGDGDLPDRIQDFTFSGDKVSDVQFGDFNAPIEIVLPKCGM